MLPLIYEDAVVECAYRLPPLPQSAGRLLSLLAEAETDLDEIVYVIEFDPILTMKLLRMANSIISASSRRIGTVKDAVVRLGTRTVTGLAVGASIQPLLPQTIPGYRISGSDFWMHSLAAALSAEMLLSCAPKTVSPFAFSAALLHDIGKLVLGQFLSSPILDSLECAMAEGKQAPVDAEMEILSMHHGEVGGVVAQHWQLPESIVNGIIYHHFPEAGGEAICSVTCLANCAAHAATASVSSADELETAPPPPDFALKSIGISMKDYVELCEETTNRLAAVAAMYEA